MVVSKHTARAEFARRLGESMASSPLPPADRRQWRGWLARTYGVSVESARKWLVGEAIPDTARLSGIASDLGTSVDYLLMGPRAPADDAARNVQDAREPASPTYRQGGPPRTGIDVDVLGHILELMESIEEGTPAERARVIAAFYDAVVTGGHAMSKATVLKLLRSA